MTYQPWTYRPPEGSPVGQRGLRRNDGLSKASGAALYTKDIKVGGMLYAKMLMSPYAHAIITNLDTTAAAALPGVVDILRWDDPDIAGQRSARLSDGNQKWLCLAGRTDHYNHQVGVAVVAKSEELCDRALRLLNVTWNQQTFYIADEDALAPGATPILTEVSPAPVNNVLNTTINTWGDVEAGFLASDRIIEFTYFRGDNLSACVEPASVVAEWRGEYLDMWVRQQNPTLIQQELALDMGIPIAKMDIRVTHQGGAFGGINWLPHYRQLAKIAAVLAKRVKQPVKLIFDEAKFQCANDDVGTYNIKIGVKNDGTIMAVSSDAIAMRCPLGKLRNGSKIPNIYQKSVWAANNRSHRQMFRHGTVETNGNQEVYSHVAGELGLDPTDVALLNDGFEGQDWAAMTAYQIANGFEQRQSLAEVLDVGKTAFGWAERWHLPGTRPLANGKMHGVGFNTTIKWSNGQAQKNVAMTVRDGKVQLLARTSDMGHDSPGNYARVVAAEMGMLYQDVTARTERDNGSFDYSAPGGSSGLVNTICNLVEVARDAKQQILALAVKDRTGGPFFPGKTVEELDIKDSMVFEIANPLNTKTVKEICNAFSVGGITQSPVFAHGTAPLVTIAKKYQCKHAAFVEVEVDTELGDIDVTKVTIVDDEGCVINPDACNGQQYGGVHMGVAKSRDEERVYDPQTGVWLNSDLIWYPVWTSLDCGPIDCHLIETHGGNTAYGCFGTGENTSALTSAITGDAFYNATGVRLDDFPTTPIRVLKALGKI